jgi:hypothetical protein
METNKNLVTGPDETNCVGEAQQQITSLLRHDQFRHLSNITVITAIILEAAILILLFG